MTKAADARIELERRLGELKDRAGRIDAHQHERDRDVPKDWDDLAQYRENDEVVDRLDDMTREEIGRIEGALQRIASGTWGTCGGCREVIEEARLRAMPTAVTCLSCTRAAERRESALAR